LEFRIGCSIAHAFVENLHAFSIQSIAVTSGLSGTRLRVRLLRLTVCRPLHPLRAYTSTYTETRLYFLVMPDTTVRKLRHPTIRSLSWLASRSVFTVCYTGHSPRAWSDDLVYEIGSGLGYLTFALQRAA